MHVLTHPQHMMSFPCLIAPGTRHTPAGSCTQSFATAHCQHLLATSAYSTTAGEPKGEGSATPCCAAVRAVPRPLVLLSVFPPCWPGKLKLSPPLALEACTAVPSAAAGSLALTKRPPLSKWPCPSSGFAAASFNSMPCTVQAKKVSACKG